MCAKATWSTESWLTSEATTEAHAAAHHHPARTSTVRKAASITARALALLPIEADAMPTTTESSTEPSSHHAIGPMRETAGCASHALACLPIKAYAATSPKASSSSTSASAKPLDGDTSRYLLGTLFALSVVVYLDKFNDGSWLQAVAVLDV